MSKVVFLGFLGHGHINPSLPVVKELIDRGEEVVYYSIDPFKEMIEQTGATYASYGNNIAGFFSGKGPQGQGPGLIMLSLMQTCDNVLTNMLGEIRAQKADYIIFDRMAIWGKFVAQKLALPSVCSNPSMVLTPEIMRASGSGMMKAAMQDPLMKDVDAVASQIAAKHGVAKPEPFDVFRSDGDITITYTSREFQPMGDTFNEAIYKFVGPSLMKRPQAAPFPFEKIGDKPLLYISLGTVFNQQEAFFKACLEAFAGSDVSVIMSIGRATPKESLGAIPANFIVEPFVPQLEILKKAKLFITHGGMNSVSEGLYENVPLIVVPQGADQFAVANRVQEVGAGKVLFNADVTPQRLRELSQEILATPSYVAAATRIGASLRSAGGYKKAADEIFALKQRSE